MKIKSKEEIELMREGGSRLSLILHAVSEKALPGVRTEELDRLAESLIRQGGDTPAFLRYRPDWSHRHFPASLCVSVNDEVVHGIPGTRVLSAGDIVGLDLGLKHEGLYVDMAVTVPVGEVSESDRKLMEVTKGALLAGIAQVRDGARLGVIGGAVQTIVENAGFSVVRELGGHGVGYEIHEAPFVPHFKTIGKGERLEAGQTIAIEPMINAGGEKVKFDDSDGYTVRTADHSNSAHYEVTLAVTETGADVLTPIFW